MRVELENKTAIFSFPITGDNIRKAKGIPGDLTWRGSKVAFTPRISSLDYIIEQFPGVVLDSTLDKKYKDQKAQNTFISAVSQSEVDNLPFKFKTPPFEHQKTALALLRDTYAFALLMEMGTGKTKVSIDDIAYQYTKGRIDTVIVIAPNGVHRNWVENELPAHMSDDIPFKAMFWKGLSSKKAQEEFDQFIEFSGLRILAINYEAVITAKGSAVLKSLAKDAMIILDESTRIKNPKAKVTGAINGSYRGGKYNKGLRDFAKMRRILTGTPVTQGPLDIFAQFQFLDPDFLGFKNFFAFRANYATLKQIQAGNRMVQVVDKYINVDDLKRRIEPHSYRVLKKDCLDLPPKVFQKVYYSLSEEQRRLYNEMKTFLIAEFEGQTVTAQIALTKLLRLRQLLGGFVNSEEGELITIKPNARLNRLEELLEDINGKAIIWSVFTPEIRAIKKLLGDKAVAYYGEVSRDDRAEAIERFQNGDATYFIGNPRAAGLGLTLTAATNVIYYSNDYSLEIRQQSEDRAHRHGQQNKVTYFDLIGENTVDEKIIWALRNKKDLAQLITGDNLKEWL